MIQDVYRFAEGETAPDGAEARAYVRYTPDREEIYRALRLADRERIGPVRIAIECGAALAMGTLCFFNFGLSPSHPNGSLTIGILCVLFAAIAGLYAPISAYVTAKQQAAAARKVHLWIGEDFLGFGKTEKTYTRWEYRDFRLLKTETLWVLLQGKSQMVILPTAAIPASLLPFLEERVNNRV